LVVALALGLGFAFLAVARSAAAHFGLMDRPDGRRKVQKRPVAVVGGIALFATTLIALLLAGQIDPQVGHLLGQDARQAGWLLAAAAVIVLIGVLDDLKNLRARFKLLGQLFAVLLAVIGGGYVISSVSLFRYELHFGDFAIPITVLWFLAAVNAINLLDGMDGMLGSLGLVICASLGVMTLARGPEHGFGAVVAFAMAGGLVAFLWFNKPPASVYMGDAGSMLIGLVVAALSIRSSIKGPAVAILAPVGLLVLPFLDTSAAIVRRKLTGRGLAAADRGHLHHLLQKRGWSIQRSLLVVSGLGLLAAAGAIVSTYSGNDLVAVAAAAAVVVLLLVRGLFGVAEARLLAKRAVSAISATVTRPQSIEMEVRLQGTAEWEHVWKEITGRAADLSLTAVYLDVNAPLWQEGYHRRWETRGHQPDHLTGWRVDLPLVGHGQVIGRLTVFGDRGDACMGDRLTEVSALARKAEELAYHATLPYVHSAATPPVADSPTPPPRPLVQSASA
jgi:UDP-GlcNAc:undecaprenyl-phosphate GlcNAc-1-phosphate transferase